MRNQWDPFYQLGGQNEVTFPLTFNSEPPPHYLSSFPPSCPSLVPSLRVCSFSPRVNLGCRCPQGRRPASLLHQLWNWMSTFAKLFNALAQAGLLKDVCSSGPDQPQAVLVWRLLLQWRAEGGLSSPWSLCSALYSLHLAGATAHTYPSLGACRATVSERAVFSATCWALNKSLALPSLG